MGKTQPHNPSSSQNHVSYIRLRSKTTIGDKAFLVRTMGNLWRKQSLLQSFCWGSDWCLINVFKPSQLWGTCHWSWLSGTVTNAAIEQREPEAGRVAGKNQKEGKQRVSGVRDTQFIGYDCFCYQMLQKINFFWLARIPLIRMMQHLLHVENLLLRLRF